MRCKALVYDRLIAEIFESNLAEDMGVGLFVGCVLGG